MNVFIPISEKLFIAGDSNERKLSFISFINLDSNELGGGGGEGIGTVLEKRTTRKINKMHK